MTQEAAPAPEVSQRKIRSRLTRGFVIVGSLIGGLLVLADRADGAFGLLCHPFGIFCPASSPTQAPPRDPVVVAQPISSAVPASPASEPAAPPSRPPTGASPVPNAASEASGSTAPPPTTIKPPQQQAAPRLQAPSQPYRSRDYPPPRVNEDPIDISEPAPLRHLSLASYSSLPSYQEERVCRPRVIRATGVSGHVPNSLTRPGNRACVEVPPGSELILLVELCDGETQTIRQVDVGREAWGGGRQRTSPATFLFSFIYNGRESTPQRIPSRPGYIHSLSFAASSAQAVRLFVSNPVRRIGQPITQHVCWISVR